MSDYEYEYGVTHILAKQTKKNSKQIVPLYIHSNFLGLVVQRVDKRYPSDNKRITMQHEIQLSEIHYHPVLIPFSSNN